MDKDKITLRCAARLGEAMHGWARPGGARHGKAGRGYARQGYEKTKQLGWARRGMARPGWAWHGRARLGVAGQGKVMEKQNNVAWQGSAWLGMAGHCEARICKERQGKVMKKQNNLAGLGGARRGKTRLGTARLGKARQGYLLVREALERVASIKVPGYVSKWGEKASDWNGMEWIDRIFEVMAACPQHIFQILTKRPYNIEEKLYGTTLENGARELGGGDYLPNVWFGTTVECRVRTYRIKHLFKFPAAVRFVSIEPMLGPVDITNKGLHGLDWVICGGETGPGARPMHPDWVRAVRDDCQVAKVPFFFKQWGEWAPYPHCWLDEKQYETNGIMARVGKKRAGRLLDGREWNEMPEIVKCESGEEDK